MAVAALSAVPSGRQRERKEFKMVLIGETGTGKTSFLELLLNYAEQDKAFRDKAEDTFDLHKVKPRSGVAKNRTKRKYESDTTESKRYKAKFEHFQLIVIDTPGFSDTRGAEQQQLNISNIIEYVRQEDYIHCVCLIMNGRLPRLTEAMKILLTEITTILPQVVLDKLFVVCTNCQKKYEVTFDYEILAKHNLGVPKERRFNLDNPYAKLRAATKVDKDSDKDCEDDEKDEDDEDDEEDEATLTTLFLRTRKKLDKMFSIIQTMIGMETHDFGAFWSTCSSIRLSFAKLAVHHINRSEVEKRYAEVCGQERPQLSLECSTTELNETADKNIYCTTCKQNCHPGCNCWMARIFIRCCSEFTSGRCTKCIHKASRHNRSKHRYHTTTLKLFVLANTEQERKREYEERIQSYNSKISIETRTLKAELQIFQCIGSHFALSEQAKRQIEVFKEDNSQISGYSQGDEINGILTSTYQVIQNPYSVNNGEAKYRWACGMLGADPNKLRLKDIATLYRQQSRAAHPDATRELDHAKKYLEEHCSLYELTSK